MPTPERLVQRLESRGFRVPRAQELTGLKPSEKLERIAAEHPVAQALVDCRSLSQLQEWLLALDGAEGRLRGRHFIEATGRWGMNSHPLHALPKHSRGAKAMRKLLTGPPGQRLVAADFSSFELRLLAGLSQDPVLLHAAAQADAIGWLAENYFGIASGPAGRAFMKSYVYPLSYGGQAWGFAEGAADFPD